MAYRLLLCIRKIASFCVCSVTEIVRYTYTHGYLKFVVTHNHICLCIQREYFKFLRARVPKDLPLQDNCVSLVASYNAPIYSQMPFFLFSQNMHVLLCVLSVTQQLEILDKPTSSNGTVPGLSIFFLSLEQSSKTPFPWLSVCIQYMRGNFLIITQFWLSSI